MKRSGWTARLALWAALAIGLACGAARAGEDALWTREFDRAVEWQKLSDAGYLVVGTKEALFGLDPATGETVWQLDQFKKMPEDFLEMLPGTQFGVITYKGGLLGFGTTTYLVDMIDGRILWDTSGIELANCSGQFFMPSLGGLLLFGVNKGGAPVACLVELASGRRLWEQEKFFGKAVPPMFSISDEKKLRMAVMGNQEPLPLPGGDFLELTSAAGLRRVRGADGAIVWTSPLKIKTVPAPRSGYAPLTLSADGATVYVPHERFLHAVRVADGALLWEKPEKLRGGVQQIEVTPAGVVCKGGWAGGIKKPKDFITVLDPATGVERWKKPFKDLDNATTFAVREGRIVLYADRTLFSIGIADGDVRELADKIKLGDGELPTALELRDEGYLLRGSQNLLLFDFDGREVYHAYHKAPQASLLAKVASTAAIMAVNAASAANAYSQAQATGRDQRYSLITSNPVMGERFKETVNSRHYVYMLAVVGGGTHRSGAGVVRVDKRTGAEAGSIVLGTKEPNYELDEIGGRLFFMPDDKVIRCYRFE